MARAADQTSTFRVGDARIFDATGETPICEGDVVVTADRELRLHVSRVRRVERTRLGHIRVRLENGGWTTPDRLAVVESA